MLYTQAKIKFMLLEDIAMDQKSKNIETIINVMSAFMGIRLIKQIMCVILLIFDVEEKRIIAGLKVSPNTVIKYANLLNSGRLSELFEDNLYRPKSKLEDYLETLREK